MKITLPACQDTKAILRNGPHVRQSIVKYPCSFVKPVCGNGSIRNVVKENTLSPVKTKGTFRDLPGRGLVDWPQNSRQTFCHSSSIY